MWLISDATVEEGLCTPAPVEVPLEALSMLEALAIELEFPLEVDLAKPLDALMLESPLEVMLKVTPEVDLEMMLDLVGVIL